MTDKCWCEKCDLKEHTFRSRMSTCPECGSKRCPRAKDHLNSCTGTAVKESLTPQKRHRHESSMWFIAGGYWSWCYQCGAIKMNKPGERWQKPNSIGGQNPAMKGKK